MSTTIQPPKVETPAAPAAPAPEKPAVPAPTAEEIEASVAEFKSTFYSGDDLRTRQAKAKKKKAAETPKAEDSIVIEDPAPPADPSPAPDAPEPEPAPAKVVVPPPPRLPVEPPNEEALTDRLAASVAERLRTPATPEPAKPTEREQRMALVYEEMAKIDPSYTGLGAKVAASKSAEATHIAKWQEQNPGEKFDPDAEEHDEFYKRNTVDYAPEDFALAVDRIAARHAEEIADRIVEKRFKQREQEQQAQRETHAIAGVVNTSITEFIERAEPAFKELVTGKPLSDEVVKQMEEADPVALMILKEECEPMAAMIREIEELSRLGDAYKMDPNKTIPLANKRASFQPVKQALATISALEDEMLKLPPDQTVRGGRRLVSNADFFQHLEAIGKSRLTSEQKAAESRKFTASYYHLGADDFRDGIIAQAVADAQARIQKFRTASGSRVVKQAAPAPEVGKQAVPAAPAKPQQTQASRPAATVVTSSDIVNTRKPVVLDDEDPLTIIRKRSFGQ